MEHPTPADLARIALRREKALELRLAGKNLREIGRELGVSHEQARKDVAAELAASAERSAELAEKVRGLELARLDKARERAFAVLMASPVESELGLKAIDRIVRLSERTAKLVGADAPVEVNTTLFDGASPEVAARLVREAFGEGNNRGGSSGDAARPADGDGGPVGGDAGDLPKDTSGT